MNWYVQAAIATGIGFLTTYVMQSKKISPEKKQAFQALMLQVNMFVAEIENPAAAPLV